MEVDHELVDTSLMSSADVLPESGQPRLGRSARFGNWLDENKWPITVYTSTRVALFAFAVILDAVFGIFIHRESLSREFGNWDGWWYIRIATIGYHHSIGHVQTSLGFFPLYSMAIWLVAHALFCSYVIAGFIISTIGGLVATIQVQRLARDWWGPAVARKSVLLFCLFPGSIIFSMVYSEGILIPLVLGCLLALSHKKWVLAGVLAGVATAVGPDALTVIPMCLAASFVQLRKYGWHDTDARRSLIAPALSPFGAVAFASFLWAWTGTPFASFIAQSKGWHERTTPLAMPNQLLMLIHEIGFRLRWSRINLNIPIGLLGLVFLIVGLRWLWRDRRTVPLEAMVFTIFMSFLMVTSLHVPPTPRLLITAFPVVLIFAKRLQGRAWTRMIWITGALFFLLSAFTYVGSFIRP